jgi:hypothetical protein
MLTISVKGKDPRYVPEVSVEIVLEHVYECKNESLFGCARCRFEKLAEEVSLAGSRSCHNELFGAL